MNIGIVGGGIAGLSAALALQNIGINATVFDAAPKFAPVGAGLALAANAMKGFQRLGIADQVIADGNCLDGFHILDAKGRLINRTDSRAMSEKYGLDNFVIHRANLHAVLLKQLPAKSLLVNKKAIQFSSSGHGVTLHFQDNTTTNFDHILVADGLHSAVRLQLLPAAKPRYAGYTCWRGVIDNPGFTAQYASETWGKAGRVGWTPLAHGKIYWFACINAPENDPAMRDMTAQGLQKHFRNYHAPIPELFAHTKPEELLWHDIHDVAPISRFAFQDILLIGDAAHATTPNMGQGACQAIEDAVVLADELRKDFNFNAAAHRFEKRRLSRTRWITKQSRFLGEVAQFTNPIVMSARNFLLRHLPQAVNEKQLEKVYRVDF